MDTKSGHKEEIHQLQVISWPDYLAPQENIAFPLIEHLISVIKNDNITNSPTMIHCRYL